MTLSRDDEIQRWLSSIVNTVVSSLTNSARSFAKLKPVSWALIHGLTSLTNIMIRPSGIRILANESTRHYSGGRSPRRLLYFYLRPMAATLHLSLLYYSRRLRLGMLNI